MSASAASPSDMPEEDYLDETIRAKNLPPFPCDEDIVIAGMAGRVAGCRHVADMDEALFGMKDVLTTTEEAGRYENGLFGNQAKMGAIPDFDKFDAGYFNMYPYMANSTDPSVRLLLERVYEALVDAGESPESFKGTRTSVIVGALPSDSPECALTHKRINNYSYIGYVPCHMANRISYSFDLNGPSFTIDSACSSSLAAMETAVNHIRMGYSDNAIVASCNLVQNPYSTLTATHVGMLCSSGYCKAFDKDGDGFVRADGSMVVVLRKRSQAKRVYGTIMHLRGNNDGFTKAGLSVPSAESQSRVVQSVYKDLGIDPNIVKFAECHGPGTQVGDGIEVDALAKLFCSSREGPLYIGSVKTNIAHCEGASGLASVIKCLVSLNNKKIAPNLHYKIPNPSISSLQDGRVKVVTEALPMESGLISCSSFGVGGTNYNLCLRAYKNEKRALHPASKVPRLFVYGCRTKEAAAAMMEEVRKFRHNVEYHALLQSSSIQPTSRLPFRFYDVLNSQSEKCDVKRQSFKKRPVWLSFSGMGTQWKGMGRTMMALDVFRKSMERSAAVVQSRYQMDLLDAIYNCTDTSFDLAEMTFVGITSIGMALYDLIDTLGIEWDHCLGHSLGETAAAYADGSITQEEALLLSYWRGRSTRETDMPPGKMLAVGMDWDEAFAVCPENCWPACHNYKRNVTISGLVEPAAKLCADLTARGYFAREVNTLGKCFHCPTTQHMVPILRKELGHEIVTRKKTSRFMSTSIPQEKWDLEQSQTVGLEYFINNLVSPVLYYEVATLIPENAVVIEVSPNAIFYGTIKKTVPSNVTVLSCMKGDQKDNVEYFLNQMGQAYINGVDMETLKLYQPVQFPVPKGTPYTSPLASKMWDHSVSWYTPRVEDDRNDMRGNDCLWEPDMTSTQDMFLKSHIVNGRNIYPPGGYLLMAWKTIAHLRNKVPFHEMAVILEDVAFVDDRVLNPNGDTTFTCSLQSNGAFEIRESKEPVMRGFIHPAKEDMDFDWPEVASKDLDSETCAWSSDEVYELLGTQGKNLKGEFRNIIRATHDFSNAEIGWDKEWEVKMDSILQCAILHNQGVDRPGRVVTIDTVHIRPLSKSVDVTDQVCLVKIEQASNTLVAGNIVMHNVQCIMGDIPEDPSPCVRTKKMFVPFEHTEQPGKRFLEFASAGLSKLIGANSMDDFITKYKASNGESSINSPTEISTKESIKNTIFKLAQNLTDLKTLPYSLSESLKLLESLAFNIDPETLLSTLKNNSIVESCLDIVTQNASSAKLSAMELNAKTSGVYEKITPIMSTLFSKIDMTYTVTDEQDLTTEAEAMGMEYENWSLNESMDKAPKNKYDLVVAKHVFSNISNLDEGLSKLNELLLPQGFVLIQEAMKDNPLITALKNFKFNTVSHCPDVGAFLYDDKTLTKTFQKHGFEIIYKRSDSVLYSVYLIRKTKNDVGENMFVNVTDDKGSWVTKLQDVVSKVASSSSDQNTRLWMFTEALTTGAIGMLRSIQKENSGVSSNMRCIVQDGKSGGLSESTSSEKSPSIQQLMKKDLVVNECRNGVWGIETTIGFDPENDIKSLQTSRAYLNMPKGGDLGSFTFLPLSPSALATKDSKAEKTDSNTVSVYYAAVYDKDLTLCGERHSFGMEFVGRSSSGDRVMGISLEKAMATEIRMKQVVFSMPVPNSLTLKAASGLLQSYSSALYALRMLVKAKAGQNLIISSGESGLGQAAISVALHYGLNVFTTVATEKARDFVTKQFPQVVKDHVCQSKESNLVQKFLAKTKGRGLDIVLYTKTSAATDVAGLIRSITKGGYFIDLAGAMTSIAGHSDCGTLIKDKNILEVDMRRVMTGPDMADERKTLFGLVQDGLRDGLVRPLQTIVFGLDGAENAFKMSAKESTIGNVTMEFRQEETVQITIPKPIQVDVQARTVCYPDCSYLVFGGLQSLGLEVAQWLSQRGARTIVLVGSDKVHCAYQRQRIEMLERQEVRVVTWTKGHNSQQAVSSVLDLAQSLGPIGGIVVMPQNTPEVSFKDTTPEIWQSIIEANHQVSTVRLLDSVSRSRATPFGQNLHIFCAFTTLTGGHCQVDGTPANFSNSLVERIMATRRAQQLPGQVVQIGSVADLNNCGNRASVVGGTHAQNMASIVQNLDEFLNCSHVVTSSYVLPAQREDNGDTVEGTPVQLAIAMELGVPDFSNYDQSATLMDLGMDSIVGNQTVSMLANKFRITIDPKALTQLTVEQLARLG